MATEQPASFQDTYPALQIAARMILLGHEQRQAANALESKRIEHDRRAAERACDAIARARDWSEALEAWQAIVREYSAESVALWQDEISLIGRGQSEINALVRDVLNDWNGAWSRALAGAPNLAGKLPGVADWFQIFDRMTASTAQPKPPASATPHAQPTPLDANAHTR